MNNVVISGVGSYVPENIVTNNDLAKIVDTNDEWIQSRTGIKERRVSINENTSDLAYKAALKALNSSGEVPENIDIIICATTSPDFLTPATACLVQHKLGAKNAIAFDISAACTGLIYSIAIAAQFIKTGFYKTALVIGAETLSKQIDWSDRTTCVLFGDGASAVVLKSSDDHNSLLKICLQTDGSKWNYLTCDNKSLKDIYSEPEPTNSYITMIGGDVFKFAVKSLVENIKTILDDSAYKIEDIKYIIPHQANMRIIKAASQILKLPIERFFLNLDRYANTSAASIGIALDELYTNQQLKSGDKLILVGFGAGMTSGSILLEWI